MYKEQYSPVFSNMVSKAKVLGILSTPEMGDCDGALQVVIQISSLTYPILYEVLNLFMSSILKFQYSFFFLHC